MTLPFGENPLEFLDETYPAETTGISATAMWKFHNPNFNRFSVIHSCDGQRDRGTGDSIYAL